MVAGMDSSAPAVDSVTVAPVAPAAEAATKDVAPKKGKAASQATTDQPAAEKAQRASLGRVVIVKGQISNGSDEHPALITRVWDPATLEDGSQVDYVNTMLQPDAAEPRPVTSVHLFATREAAIAYRAKNPGHPAAFWPARV